MNIHNKKLVDSCTENIVSQLVQDETGKRQYYRPVYSLHKWWARRPGALFRSIILRANDSNDELFTTTQGGSLSQYSSYFKDHSLEDVVILDPFMGGGTTIVEASRLGAKVIGSDLNPVSYWIVRETIKPIDLEKLDTYFQMLERTAGEKIKSLYRTKCIHCNSQGDGLYTFWVRYVKCLRCSENVHLFKRTLLNKGLSRNTPPSRSNPATAFCPRCFALNDWYGEDDFSCRFCTHSFNPQTGTYDQGSYICSQCHEGKTSLIQTLEENQKLREKLVVIEYWCQRCRDRFYKSPDEADLTEIARIEETVEESKDELIFPKQKILEGSSSARWRRHNYQYYHEVFNARQLLAFNFLIKAIQTIPEEEYRNAFITVFSNALEYNNMMTPYNYPHRKLHHLFNYHAMPLTTTPVENAVWGAGAEGAGTFTNCYRRYFRAKEYCHKPFDKFKNSSGAVQTVSMKSEKISARFVSSFEELQETARGALLLCGDSSNLPLIPNNSVNFVITDPPYFDSIHYSELSNFFYIWLSALVDHHYFSSNHVPTEEEAIVNAGMDKGEKEYKNLLSSVFKESERVLKKDGKLIFTFHHAKWQAWWTVLAALIESRFRVVDYFSVMSEYKVNPHIRNKQALDMDLVLICQKMVIAHESLPLSPIEVLERTIKQLPSEASNNSDNELFLYFMGELLKTAGSIQEGENVTYGWFTDALNHCNNFLAHFDRTSKEEFYETPMLQQLRLFESNCSDTKLV